MIAVMKDRLTATWLITGGLAVLLPLTIWGFQRIVYFARFGAQDYMQESQENYEQAQQYYQQQNQKYWRYYWTGYYNVNDQTFYQKCWGIDWFCRRRQYYYATYGPYGNRANDQQQAPLWYIFLGGKTERMQQWEEQNGHERHANAFVYGGLGWAYLLTLGLFFALLAYGVSIFKKEGSIAELRAVVVATAVIAFMNMIMSVGLISTDDDDLNDYYFGWYGQMGVLMVYTNFWIMFFAIAFAIFFRRFGNESIRDRKARKQEEAQSYHPGGDYKNADDSSVVVIN